MARLRKLVAIVMMVSVFASCTTWKIQPESAVSVVENKRPSQVRLNLRNGTQVEMFRPVIEKDQVVGSSEAPRFGRTYNISVPVADVVSIELSSVHAGKTFGAVVLVGLSALAVAALVALSEPTPVMTGQWSCPLVYSLNNGEWKLDSGTFGGAIMPSLRRTDVDNLDFARPRDGRLSLKLANELDEIDYVDAIDVLAVDHAPGVTVAPQPDGALMGLGAIETPVRAIDFAGRDVMHQVRARDDRQWESHLRSRRTDSAEVRDGIDLWFKRPAGTTARLVVDGRNTPWAAYALGQFVTAHGSETAAWYAAMEANPEKARQLQAMTVREAFLRVSVETANGWEERGHFWEAGPEVGKRQAMRLDLSGIRGDLIHVRLDAPASFWLIDSVGLNGGAEPSFTVRTLSPRPLTGVDGPAATALIAKADGRDLVLHTGDSRQLDFDVPSVPAGSLRSYVLRTTGWYHINTPETGEPNRAVLYEVMQPGGIARWSAGMMNQAMRRQ
jgi:hypothetical protein